MAGVAAAFAAEQVVPILFRHGKGRFPRKIVIEFRREGTNAVRTLVTGNRQREFVEVFVREGAIRGAELNRSGISAKRSSACRCAAYGGDVGRPSNFQRPSTPNRLEERLVSALRELPHYTSGIRVGHFLGIQRWALCLVSCGILQPVSARPAIPEVAAVEIGLALVIMERRKVTCVNVTLWVSLRNPVIRIGSGYRDGNRSRVRSACEYA